MFHRIHVPLTALLVAAVACCGVAEAKAPHDDWPPIHGETWINQADRDTTHHGTNKNDELLGGHGDDVIYGHRGSDVIWGDYKPTGNTSRQADTVFSGGGNDWIYASHGRNTIDAGAGNDTVRVWFGRGTVDCGPGRDILYVSHKTDPKVKRTHCETISHKSARDVANGE
jgi:hypothetical protein